MLLVTWAHSQTIEHFNELRERGKQSSMKQHDMEKERWKNRQWQLIKVLGCPEAWTLYTFNWCQNDVCGNVVAEMSPFIK